MTAAFSAEYAHERAVETLEAVLADGHPRAVILMIAPAGTSAWVRAIRMDHGNTDLDAYGDRLVGVYDLGADSGDVVEDLLAVGYAELPRICQP